MSSFSQISLPQHPYDGYTLLLNTKIPELTDLYSKQCSKLYSKEHQSNEHKDSGFDLYMPQTIFIFPHTTKLIDLEVRCAAYKITHITAPVYNPRKYTPSPYYIYARSSISKKHLILANSVGIIDSGYRGNLMAALHNTSNETIKIEKDERLLQICLPGLCNKFVADVVDDLDKTERGEGGLGSTGK